jgi:hypothetical protein
MSDGNGGGNGGGNDGGNGGAQHLRIVPLKTATDQRKHACVLKLRELLAQAEQGRFIGLAIVAAREKAGFSLHWSGIDGNEIQFIGALELLKSSLADIIKRTFRKE